MLFITYLQILIVLKELKCICDIRYSMAEPKAD